MSEQEQQQQSPVTDETATERMADAVGNLSDYPGGFGGRGVVICGGGPKYFPSVWVGLHLLRRAGCQLPVELWHLDDAEMTDQMRDLVAPLGVTCVNATQVRRRHPVRILGGWEMKAYAILRCRFREVILLDADNVAVVDPTFLFDTLQYHQHGAIFWPDYLRLDRERVIWELCGTRFRDEPEVESGQIVVDKARCWQPLSLAAWMNEHSDFWYRHIYGDKETFHLAWRRLDREYAMPPYPIHSLDGVMCQHDFDGRRVFQHRNVHKWQLYGANPLIPDFDGEPAAFAALDDLRRRWTEQAGKAYRATAATDRERQAAATLHGRRWTYHRLGYDERPLSLAPDGSVGDGAGGRERTWNVTESAGGIRLALWGEDGRRTCSLCPVGSDHWVGSWDLHERMGIRLVPALTSA